MTKPLSTTTLPVNEPLVLQPQSAKSKYALTIEPAQHQETFGSHADPAQFLAGLASGAGTAAADLLRLNHALGGPLGAPFVLPVAHNRTPALLDQDSYRLAKRVMDILFAVAAILLLSPVLLLCAAAVLVESPGPVLFRQSRLGRHGRSFTILKFRTMIQNAEEVLNQTLERDPAAKEEWAKDRKLRNDPRVTRLGRFLRRTSLDELPQFWNVLVGDMSLVGPRPIVKSEIAYYDDAYRLYCAVRPGITGLWQVSGRNDTGYSRRIALDVRYVTSLSGTLDLSIFFKTFRALIRGAGAY